MRTLRVGTCGFGPGPRRDPTGLDVVELPLPLPRRPDRATLLRWRRDAPEGFEFILRAPPSITHPPSSRALVRAGSQAETRGGFADTASVRRAWKETVELARTLDAGHVVFRSPPGVGPDEATVARLVRFFTWAHRDGLRFAWEPRDPAWTEPDLAALCRELSLTHLVDPFERRPARGRPPFYRLNGIGPARGAYDDQALAALVRLCDEHGRDHPMYDPGVAYCVFGTPSMRDDAARLRGRAAAADA